MARASGGDGNDLILNTEPYGEGNLRGEGGDDIILGNSGDYLFGGDGSDKLCVDGTATRIDGADGFDPGAYDSYCGDADYIDSASPASGCPCSIF